MWQVILLLLVISSPAWGVIAYHNGPLESMDGCGVFNAPCADCLMGVNGAYWLTTAWVLFDDRDVGGNAVHGERCLYDDRLFIYNNGYPAGSMWTGTANTGSEAGVNHWYNGPSINAGPVNFNTDGDYDALELFCDGTSCSLSSTNRRNVVDLMCDGQWHHMALEYEIGHRYCPSCRAQVLTDHHALCVVQVQSRRRTRLSCLHRRHAAGSFRRSQDGDMRWHMCDRLGSWKVPVGDRCLGPQ